MVDFFPEVLIDLWCFLLSNHRSSMFVISELNLSPGFSNVCFRAFCTIYLIHNVFLLFCCSLIFKLTQLTLQSIGTFITHYYIVRSQQLCNTFRSPFQVWSRYMFDIVSFIINLGLLISLIKLLSHKSRWVAILLKGSHNRVIWK